MGRLIPNLLSSSKNDAKHAAIKILLKNIIHKLYRPILITNIGYGDLFIFIFHYLRSGLWELKLYLLMEFRTKRRHRIGKIIIISSYNKI